jgi:drug/metabolite transporter (DMT)-like permease
MSVAVRTGEGRSCKGTDWGARAALLGLALLWGATFVPVKMAVRDFPVLAFIGVRFLCALVVLIPCGLVRLKRRSMCWRQVLQAVATGWIFLAGYGFQTFGLRLTAAGRASFITGLSTVFVPLILVVFFGEQLRWRPLAGALLATGGMAILGLDGAVHGSLRGDLLVLGGAVAFAAHIIATSRWGSASDPVLFTMVQVAAVAPLAVIGSICLEGPFPAIGASVLGAAAFTGVVVTAGGLIVQVWAQARLSPTHAAVILATEPGFGVLFGWLLIGETLTRAGLAGCALILAGMLVAEGSK